MLREWLHLTTRAGNAKRRPPGHRRETFHGRVERLESRMVLSASIGAHSAAFESTHFNTENVGTGSAPEMDHSAFYVSSEFHSGSRDLHFGGLPQPPEHGATNNLYDHPAPPRPMMPPSGFGGQFDYRPQTYTVILFIEMPAPNGAGYYSEQPSQPEVSPPAGFSREPQLAKAGPSTATESTFQQNSLQASQIKQETTPFVPAVSAALRAPAGAASAVTAPIVSVNPSSTVQISGLSDATTLDTAFQEVSSSELLLVVGKTAQSSVNDYGFEIELTETERLRHDGLVNGHDLTMLDDSTLSNRALKRQRDAIDEVLMRLRELPAATGDQLDASTPGAQRKSAKPSSDAADALFASEATSTPTANSDSEEGGMVWQRSNEDPTGIEILSAGMSPVDLADFLDGMVETKSSLGIHQAFDVAGPAEDSPTAPAPVEASNPTDSGSKVSTEDQPPPARNAAAWFGLAALFGTTARRAVSKRLARRWS